MTTSHLQVTMLPRENQTDTQAVGFLEGVIVYSSLTLNPDDIATRKIIFIVRRVVAVLGAAFMVAGMVSLAWFLYTLKITRFTELTSLLTYTSPILQFFWFSLLGGMFALYLVLKERDKRRPVVSRSYNETVQRAPVLQTAADIAALPRRRKRDVMESADPEVERIFVEARKLAMQYRHARIDTIHLFLGALLISSEVASIVYRLGINSTVLMQKIMRAAAQLPTSEQPPEYSGEIEMILIRSYAAAYEHRALWVTSTDLFMVVYERDERLQEIFYDMGIEREDVENAIAWLRINQRLRDRYRRYAAAGRFRSKSGIDRAMTSLATNFLNSMSEDLTRFAQLGYLEIMVDREREFDELLRLWQAGSPNIILVGEAGVGKRTLVEGLADRIVGNDIPSFLREKRLVALSVSELVSGASATEAQERLLHALSEAVRARNVIVYIEHVHHLVGIVSQGLDVADVLAEVLNKKLLYCIVSTTPQEYAATIEGTQLGNVVQPIFVQPMEYDAAIQVLESKVGSVEHAQGVTFSYPALKALVTLSDRYMHDQPLPYKAVVLLEELAVYVRNTKGLKSVVTHEDVAQLLTSKLHIPISTVTRDESAALLNLEERLHERVIGQDEAVRAVSIALRRARVELRDTNRPIATLLFLGPTGVGKTELAKAIAATYFGNESAMIRLDMSEYQNQADLYKLIGAPTGTGSSQQGILTEAVRRQPYAIVLLDELEKAHPDILNVFLQVFEDGRLTDATGRTVDFTNVIIIGTSNAATPYIQKLLDEGRALRDIKNNLLQGELVQYFRPEFINRFDNIILFKPLDENDVVAIARLMMNDVVAKLEEKGIHFQATDAAIEELARKAFDPLYGARPLRRILQDEVDAALAEYLLQGKLTRRDVVIFDVGGVLRVEKAKNL